MNLAGSTFKFFSLINSNKGKASRILLQVLKLYNLAPSANIFKNIVKDIFTKEFSKVSRKVFQNIHRK